MRKNAFRIDESLSFFTDWREVRGRAISVIGNRGKCDGATCEAGGVIFNFEEKWICLLLRMEKKW